MRRDLCLFILMAGAAIPKAAGSRDHSTPSISFALSPFLPSPFPSVPPTHFPSLPHRSVPLSPSLLSFLSSPSIYLSLHPIITTISSTYLPPPPLSISLVSLYPLPVSPFHPLLPPLPPSPFTYNALVSLGEEWIFSYFIR